MLSNIGILSLQGEVYAGVAGPGLQGEIYAGVTLQGLQGEVYAGVTIPGLQGEVKQGWLYQISRERYSQSYLEGHGSVYLPPRQAHRAISLTA